MIKSVIKRDKRSRKWNPTKIVVAIKSAFTASGEEYTEERVDHMVDRVEEEADKWLTEHNRKSIKVDVIQDIVENMLMEHGFKATAKSYILYRAERTRARETNGKLFQTIREIAAADLNNSNLLRDNGNVNGATVATSYAKVGGESWKCFNLIEPIKREHADAHAAGDIHIHDLDYYSLTMNCLFIPLAKLLERGFDTGNGYIRSPNSIGSAAALGSIIIQSNQNQMFGGQAYAHIDDDLATYVDRSFLKNLAYEIEAFVDYTGDKDATNILASIVIEKNTVNVDGVEYDDTKVTMPSDVTMNTSADYMYVGDWKVPQKVVIRAIKKTDKDTYQAMEALVHNLNSLFSRSGNQLPFSSINFGLNTTKCGRMVSRNLLKATEAGLGDGSTCIFPISIFKMKAGISANPGDPNYDLWKFACRVCAERFYPNFVSVDAPFNAQYVKYDTVDVKLAAGETVRLQKIASNEVIDITAADLAADASLYQNKYEYKYSDGRWYTFDTAADGVVTFKRLRPETAIASMGCRTRVIGNINGPSQTDGRGNLWFTTINLPAIAIRASKTANPLEAFWKELDEKLDLCADVMKDRYELIARRKYENFPFLMQNGVYLSSDDTKHDSQDSIREVLKQGSNSIGYIGIYETCKILIGKIYGKDKEAYDLGYSIVKRMRDYTDKKEKETGLNWSTFATPAENVCGRFAELDKKRYGNIEDVTDKGYYTNSHMLPFDLETTLDNKLATEAPFHALTNAGHIFYYKIEGNPETNIAAVEAAIRAMYEANLGYFTITFDQDTCRECGYRGIIGATCPHCGCKDNGENILRIRRITGYLVGRPGQSIKKSWGVGKQNELKRRKNI